MKTPAVQKHGKGVTNSELAQFHVYMSVQGAGRLQGVGAEQYENAGKQKFETQDKSELLEGLLEEIIDAQNYLTMLAIKVLAALKED